MSGRNLVLSNESKSWLLHDIVQLGNLLILAGSLITGVIFITNIKESGAVQAAVVSEHTRRLEVVETRQQETDSKLEKAVESLRQEQGLKLDKLDTKLDRLIERELRNGR